MDTANMVNAETVIANECRMKKRWTYSGPDGRLATLCFALFSALAAGSAFAQEASNILLLTLKSEQKPRILSDKMITDNGQYTNQPHFDLQRQGLYYTQALEKGDGVQMDSYFYDLVKGQTTNLTASPNTSEYSPTPLPTAQNTATGFSTIYVDEAGKQWLWAFNPNGQPTEKLSEVAPIGYQAWETENTVLTFVLGEPHTLQRLGLNGLQQVLDSHIGASIWRVPGTSMFSYSKTDPNSNEYWLMTLNSGESKTKPVVQLPDGVSYYSWLPDGSAIAAVADAKVLRYSPAEHNKAWTPWLDLSTHCKQVSRTHSANINGKLMLAAVCIK